MNEDLHVLITVEDTRNRCELKLIKAVEEVKKLLVPSVSIACLLVFSCVKLAENDTYILCYGFGDKILVGIC